MTVKMRDGEEIHVKEGDVAYIAPNHDTWVTSQEEAEAIDFY